MIKFIKLVAFIGFLAIVTAGCKKTYFSDGGTPVDVSGNLGVSTMDYLQRETTSFDTLVRLIKLSNLESAVNAKGNTFLAPRDYSIHNYFKLLYPDQAKMPSTLEALPQVVKDDIARILKNYIIPNQQIVRGGLTTAYSYVTTYGGTKARFNIVNTDYLGNVNMGAKYINFSLNVSPAGTTEVYQTAQVVTADLKSTNGIVHVLVSETHIFGFN
ncbi:fasciclin domain-containing protein [Mucilaginibacter oryzae]|uniref:Fasciclin domain-containing protein n=1 Tax=Mucilaginibacter oryzae TaxID=468058 RepID=A0A316H1C9_9SPHI|nr:fasciclin domain-containing protein [Mucilaginibacter oryzae]PWK72541.1 fasciclin domain-containing protein [Mucilaginibacter oryzae]